MKRPIGLSLAIPLSLLLNVFAGCAGSPPPDVQQGCINDQSCAEAPRLACRNSACIDPGCPKGSVYVPAARFRQGCDAGEANCDFSAQPAHMVTLSKGFCLAASELSVGQYRACLAAGKCPMPVAPETLSSLRCSVDHATWTDTAGSDEGLAMSCLLWEEAKAACTSLGGRLPTEAEWERAARGDDGRSYPWGRSDPIYCDEGVNFAGVSCPGRPWPVDGTDRQGAMVRTAYRVYDLGGNVSEWVADYYEAKAYESCREGCTDPAGPSATSTLRVRRGGSFESRTAELRSYAREFHVATGPRSDLIGVRCAFSTLF